MLQSLEITFYIIVLRQIWLKDYLCYDIEGYHISSQKNKFIKCAAPIVYVNNSIDINFIDD
jgi:hypothetical protein